MTSLYRRILLWFVLLLGIAVAVILFASPMFLLRFSGPSDPIPRMHRVFFRQAREALKQGGASQLQRYLSTLGEQLPAQYFLLDESGRDLATGDNREALLRGGAPAGPRWRTAQVYTDGGFRFVTIVQPGTAVPGSGLYLLLTATLIVALCWLFATQLVSPVRALARTMQHFGRGDITARSPIRRRDEIGGLARSFNEMADRIESLVTAERRLLQDLSHELQSPLARMAIAAKLTRTAENREAVAARLQKEITRVSEMVAGLVDITRAEGDPAALRRDPVDFQETVADIVAGCEWEAGEKAVRILPEIEPATIGGNEELLRRAVENVLRNAIHYSPEGGQVEISLAVESGEAAVVVRDHGPGVPADALERIFAPFYRVEQARERDGAGGMGLGLALAQRAVLLHQGTIRAENANPGLRVTIRLHTSQ